MIPFQMSQAFLYDAVFCSETTMCCMTGGFLFGPLTRFKIEFFLNAAGHHNIAICNCHCDLAGSVCKKMPALCSVRDELACPYISVACINRY